MRLWALAATLMVGGLSACNQKAEPAVPATTEPVPASQVSPTPPVKHERTPLEEPSGSIDPKSAEAAGQIVQSYGALMEQKRWNEANELWADVGKAQKFQAGLAGNSEVHLEMGNPGELGAAAGSIYVTMPVFFYGDTKDGQPFRRSADIILRRVNDVPGSTEAQRRWHIERIDWTS